MQTETPLENRERFSLVKVNLNLKVLSREKLLFNIFRFTYMLSTFNFHVLPLKYYHLIYTILKRIRSQYILV